jgi:transposase
MLRSQTVNTIHDFNTQGKSVQEIAQELGISRTTVRKYLKHPEAVIRKPRPQRPSKLDPYKEQIKKWVTEDYCTNCVTPVKGHHLSGEQSPASHGNGSMLNVLLAIERLARTIV